MIDKANFYKLPETEQKKELENLWANTSEDVESFANNLVEEIKYSNTPFVLGILRPRIYLPSTLAEDDQADFVIAHEKAHIKRHDHWWKP